MQFFASAVTTLQTLVDGAGRRPRVCGAWSTCWRATARTIAAAKCQGMKQLMAGGGIIVLGTTLIPSAVLPCFKGGCRWVFSPNGSTEWLEGTARSRAIMGNLDGAF